VTTAGTTTKPSKVSRNDGSDGPREIAWVACDQPEQVDAVDLDRQLTVGGPAGGSVRDFHPGISEEDRRSRSGRLAPRRRIAAIASRTHENVTGPAAGRAEPGAGWIAATASAINVVIPGAALPRGSRRRPPRETGGGLCVKHDFRSVSKKTNQTCLEPQLEGPDCGQPKKGCETRGGRPGRLRRVSSDLPVVHRHSDALRRSLFEGHAG
jgi:hypothetical protein